ncbi:MAG TPA: sugar ABC transporter substrate-binding protein [Casimicrobiaceae bacterium]|jgi:multiple sugar transport system substrate-binding protein|nr:sugar ABC transporter substrate-binding protein [Casimicrobiaceae bacterium]
MMNDRTKPEAPDALRRRLLQAGAGAAALGALPGAGLLDAHAQGAFDWKKFKGQKIEILLVKSPRGDLLTKYHKEFEDLTGIEVGSEMIPEQQQRQKAVIEFNSGNPSFDVIALSYHVQKRQFAKNNWLTDLRPYINDKSMAAPDLDFGDFAKGGLNYAVESDGRVMSLPMNLDPWIIYWNKELFAAKGLAYPANFAQIVDAAAKLNDPSKGVSGFVARGLKNANVPVWTSFLLGYGGGFVDKNGKLTTDTPEAVEAAKMYQTLLAKYGPQGVAGFNWNESQSLFLQGKAAMWLDGVGFAQPVEDPAKSRVVGKVGYGVMPPGPKAQVSALFGDGEGISTYSKKKGPAWFYLQWASNKANQTRMLQAAAGAPVRNSAYAAAQQSSDFKAPKEWVECMLKSAAIAQPGLPVIAPVTEFRDVFGIALTNMINGADPAAELKKATTEFQPVLDKSEKA